MALPKGADDQRLEGAAHLADGTARSRRARVHDCAERRRHRQRPHRARVDRSLRIEQRLGHGEHRRRRRRRPQVGRTGDLRRAAGEVGVQGVAVDGEAQPQQQGRRTVAGVVEVRLVLVDPVGHPANRLAHAGLGPIQQRHHRRPRGRFAPPLQHPGQAPFRDPARADHRLQVPAALLGLTDVREQQVGSLRDRLAPADDANARDPNALLEDLGGGSRQAAGHHAADVLPVSHDADMSDEGVAVEHGRVQRHIVEGARRRCRDHCAGTDRRVRCRPRSGRSRYVPTTAAPRGGWAGRPPRRRPVRPPATAPRRRSRAPRGSSGSGRCGS